MRLCIIWEMANRTPIEIRVIRLTNLEGPVSSKRPDLGRCWIWKGRKTSDGYALIKTGGRRGGVTLAHQVPWIALHGPKPKGMQLDHLCQIRHCVNPAHLECVTPKVNNQRSASPSANNYRKTHCKNGHEFTKENTHLCANGQRACKICRAALRRAATLNRNPNAGHAMRLRTHCPHGHEYTTENTYVYKGSRFCRACRERYAR